MKTLCVDLGNTRMKAAIFEDGKIIHLSVFDGDILSSVQALIKQFNPQKSILPLSFTTIKALKQFYLHQHNFICSIINPN